MFSKEIEVNDKLAPFNRNIYLLPRIGEAATYEKKKEFLMDDETTKEELTEEQKKDRSFPNLLDGGFEYAVGAIFLGCVAIYGGALLNVELHKEDTQRLIAEVLEQQKSTQKQQNSLSSEFCECVKNEEADPTNTIQTDMLPPHQQCL